MTDRLPPPIDHQRACRVAITLGLASLAALAAAVATSADNGARPPARGAARPLPALARCQALGEAALGDPACRAAWAEHRRRFLARGPRP